MTSSTRFHWGRWTIGGPRHYYRERLVMKAVQVVPTGGRILDAGCGTGSLMVQLALRGYEVYGVDISEESVRRTEEFLRPIMPEAKSIVKMGSAEQIDYPDGTFDALIAAEVLEHVENDHLAVREFHRLLKPGGVCIITVPANPSLWDISDEMAEHKRRYSKEVLLRLFNNASFKIEKIFFVGFPLMRIYHRLVFLRWARRIDKNKSGTVSSEDALTRVGLNRWITYLLGNLFRIDSIFSSLSLGIGILLVARKEQ